MSIGIPARLSAISMALLMLPAGMALAQGAAKGEPVRVAKASTKGAQTADGEESASGYTLDTVQVTASSAAGGVKGRQTVDKNTVVDMKDVLSQQPGVHVSGGNGASQMFSIRGLGENHLTFTVDNAGQSSQVFHHQGRFMFDPALLKSIEVEKGAGAASAGIGVTAGAIRMTTVDAPDLLAPGQNFGARVSASAQSNKGAGASLAGYGRFGERFDGLLMLNGVNQKDYKDGDGKKVEHSAVDQRSYLLKLGWNLAPDHRLSISQRHEGQSGNRTLRLNVAGLAGCPLYDGDLKYDTTNLEYKGRNLGFAQKADANIYHTKMDDSKRALGPLGGCRATSPYNHSNVKSTGANAGFVTAWQDHRIKYGVNVRREEVNNLVSRTGEKKTDWGLYGEGIWAFEPFTITTGLRYDHFSLTTARGKSASKGQLNPSINAIWDISPQWSLHAGVAQASRSPRLQEAMLLNLSRGVADGVKAERAVNAEIGAQWQSGPFTASGAVFRQVTHDYLGNNARNEQDNVGKLINRGYELEAGWRDGPWQARVAMTHSKPRLEGSLGGMYSMLNYTPTGRQWHTQLSYRFAQPRLEIGWRGQFTESLTVPVVNRAGVQTGSQTLKSVALHSLYANWQPLGHDRFNVNLSVHNVANRLYRTQHSSILEPGRDWRLSVNWRF